MKTIMILGMGESQLPLIQAAKQEGYKVVVCDRREMRTDLDGIDAHYRVDYMDRDAILHAAEKERIDGVISNSEPAMRSVAWLSQKMGLPGNTPESIEKLISKENFRILQWEAGVFAPKHYATESESQLLEKAKEMEFPVIVKPTESSGTRGTVRLDAYDTERLVDAYAVCHSFSRSGKVSIEEYVEMTNLRVNDVEIFVIGNEILWDSWLWQDRNKEMPLLPRVEIFPMDLAEEKKFMIQEAVSKIIKASGVRLGEYNVETYFTKTGEVFVIEINPRQGGNHIPQLIEEHTGVSLTRLLVTTAVGDMGYYNFLKTFQRKSDPIIMQIVFSEKNGIYRGLFIAPELKPYVQWVDEVHRYGEYIKKGTNAGDAVAYVDMRFNSIEEQKKYTERIGEYVYAVVEDA